MNFADTQSFYKERLESDAWFAGHGVSVQLSKSAVPGDVDLINEQVEASLEDKGLAFVVKAPGLKSVDTTGSGRSLFKAVLEVVVFENPERNRIEAGISATAATVGVSTLAALIGNIEIEPAEDAYFETKGPNGLIAYVVRTLVDCEIDPR